MKSFDMPQFLLTLFLSLAFMPFSLLSVDIPQKTRLAAVVNKSSITLRELDNRVKLAALSAGLDPTPDVLEKLKPQMLRTMIDETLQMQEAAFYEITADDAAVDKTIKDIENGNGMVTGQLTQLLKENHIPLDTLKNQIRAQISWIEFISQKYAPTLQVSEWEIEQEIERHKQDLAQPQYHLAEIFLNVDSPEKENVVLQDLDRLIQQLQAGAHFSALAQQFSQSASAAKGGDMGWIADASLPSDITPAVKSMTPGDLSRPIRTRHGYVILAMIDRKMPGENNNLRLDVIQSLLPFPPQASESQARALMEKLETVAASAKSCDALEAAIKSLEGQSARNKDTSLDRFPEGLRNILTTLPLNQTSTPLLTESGGLVVMVCNREEIDAKEFTAEEALHLIAEKRLALLSRRELRDLKRAAYIDLRM